MGFLKDIAPSKRRKAVLWPFLLSESCAGGLQGLNRDANIHDMLLFGMCGVIIMI